ncbi:hypothetical protein ABT348_24150 [Streptomyces olivaceus]|uniref:hypothetical protein n=1 Tax=Streptomyces olivaceus TaxID=47716 RepID=UPI0033207F78
MKNPLQTLARPFRTDPDTGRPSWWARKRVARQIARNRRREHRRRNAEQRKAATRNAAVHTVFVGGLASFAYGAWMIYHPAGFLVGGILALLYAYILDGPTPGKEPQ